MALRQSFTNPPFDSQQLDLVRPAFTLRRLRRAHSLGRSVAEGLSLAGLLMVPGALVFQIVLVIWYLISESSTFVRQAGRY